MNYYSGVILVTKENSILLQQRDNKPGIKNRNGITTFGGAMNKNETPLEGAIRELQEETNLKPNPEELIFFKDFLKQEDDGSETTLKIFLLNNVEREGLEIYEGQGYVEIRGEDDLSNYNLTPTGRKIVTEYFNRD